MATKTTKQSVTFWSCLFYKTLSILKQQSIQLYNKDTVVHEAPGYSSNQPQRRLTFSE